MAISINTNMAATRASHFLASNHANLQRSLDRLSSGKRITQPADDAGGLAVAMKLNHSINGLRRHPRIFPTPFPFCKCRTESSTQRAKSFPEWESFQSMSTGVTKSGDDIALYESEFNDLREQLYEMTQSKFNGVALFGDWTADGTARSTVGNAAFPAQSSHADVTLDVIISEDGTTNVGIHRSLLGGALMIGRTGAATDDQSDGSGTTGAMGVAGAAIDGLIKDPAVADEKNGSKRNQSIYCCGLYASIRKHCHSAGQQRWAGKEINVCPGRCGNQDFQHDRGTRADHGCGYCV